MPQWDVFVSYPHKAIAQVRPLVEALRAAGLAVWFDESGIEAFEGIQERIDEGLGGSRLLLAWYSKDYARSRPCQWELTAAYLTPPHGARVCVLNPEPGVQHIEPETLRARRFELPRDVAACAAKVKKRLVDFKRSIALAGLGPPPRHYGLNLAPARNFVGRVRDLWRLEGSLHTGEAALITGRAGPGVARLHGLGGIGKTLLAEEYALRFGRAYPGGVFWMRGQGEPLAAVGALAAQAGVALAGRSPQEVAAGLAEWLERQAKPFLWVVDDLPEGLSDGEIRAWFAPHTLGKTLITTRDGRKLSVGAAVDLDVLEPEDALALLERHRAVQPAERDEALALVEALGRHALAVEVCSSYLAGQPALSLAGYRRRLERPGAAVLELAGELHDTLPHDHSASIVETLRAGIAALPPEAREVLRLAAVLIPGAPVPVGLIQDVVARVHSLDAEAAEARVARALRETRAASLSRESDEEAGLHRVHALVTRVFQAIDPDPDAEAALRAAAVDSLNRALRDVVDIRNHERLRHHVAQARVLGARLDTAEEIVLLAWVGRHDWERGDLPAARALEEQVLAASRRLLGEEHPGTLFAMNNLAQTIQDQGDLPAARALQEQVLAARRRLLGEEHPDTLTAMNNLAQTIKSQGDLPAARALQEQVLAARRRLLGVQHLDTSLAAWNLMCTLEDLGEREAARRLIDSDLAWLLECDPERLSADQRKFREGIRRRRS